MKSIIETLAAAEETLWTNEHEGRGEAAFEGVTLTMDDVLDADARLRRFMPLIRRLFPETGDGLIESPLTEAPSMAKRLGVGRLLLKRDCDLPIAGSVKARGGIYEVLLHTEELAKKHGLLDGALSPESYAALADRRDVFSKYKMQVGSTGNLGLSIGIMSAAIGYEATVHMSADAKAWKKALLREKGVRVIEYASDYSGAVAEGRRMSDLDPMSHFVDDENSLPLFLGYAAAVLRLKEQLSALNVTVDAEHPLYVHIPCGVGGAPGGVAFGLKLIYGDDARVYFVEPTQAPCMLLALASGSCDMSVKDIGLTGLTEADGLAVGRASALVASTVKRMVAGEVTVKDERLVPYLRALNADEGVFAEPSACAAFRGVEAVKAPAGATHIAWLTGGRLVPDGIRRALLGE